MLKATKSRPVELVNQYQALLDAHRQELKSGISDRTMEIGNFAKKLFVYPGHLSNSNQAVLGISPCDIYEDKLLETASELPLNTTSSMAHIA